MKNKKAGIGLFVGALIAGALALGFVLSEPAETLAAKRVERGRYLVSTSGCHDCHTPWVDGPEGPVPDMSRALSGHPQDLTMPPPPHMGDGLWVMAAAGTNTAFAGPWGVSFTANLTPDENTGLGIWSEEIFVNTIRSGRHWGVSRPILPPMPWQVYGQMTDEDLKSIYAYLQSLPPIHNRVPEPLPPRAGDTVPAG